MGGFPSIGTQSGRGRFAALLRATTALVGCGLLASPVSHGQPNQATIVAGQASVTQSGAATTIKQSTDKAIIDWFAFSTKPGESVTFAQPGTGSIALNRVTGGEASRLNGALSANGQVMLVNPSGVIIGPSGSIDVNGLVATTSDIRNQDFLNGKHIFGQASASLNATVVNQGRITTAPGGYAVLSAPAVENSGTITANVGSVVLGGAKTFTLDLDGDKFLSYAITGPVTSAPLGPDGKPVSALVLNSGAIQADGGTVTLTARAAKGIVDSVINTGGKIQASRAQGQGGVVVIDGDDGVTVGGAITTTGATSLDTGGRISVLGDAVALAPTARLDASGPAGGGLVKIGGDFHGAAGTRTAKTTTVAKGATIKADATAQDKNGKGDGGKVVVWSDEATQFDGAISARTWFSGAQGGTVETSSKGALGITTGRVTTASANGQAGSWLLDPTDITIATGGTTTAIGNYAPTSSQTIDPSAITSGLAGGNVTISTSGGSGGNGDIFVNSAVNYTGGASNGLTLSAGRNIAVNAALSTPSLNLTANGSIMASGPLTTTGFMNLYAQGAITIGSTATVKAGSVTLQAQTGGSTLAAGSVVSAGTVGFYNYGAGSSVVLAGSVTSGAAFTIYSLYTYKETNGVSIGGNVDFGAGYASIQAGSKGLSIGSGAKIVGTGTGSNALSFVVYGGAFDLAANANISVAGGLSIIGAPTLANIAGNVTAKGLSASIAAGGGFTHVAGSTISAGSGNISITADSMAFNGGAGSITTSGYVTLMPTTTSASIGLGTAPGTLQLTNAALNSFSGFKGQTIGNSNISGTGSISIDGAINITSGPAINYDGLNLFGKGVTMSTGSTIAADGLFIHTGAGSANLAGTIVNRGLNQTFYLSTDVTSSAGVTLSGSVDLAGGYGRIYTGTGGFTLAAGASLGSASALGLTKISTNNSALVIADGASLSVGAGSVQLGGSYTQNGTGTTIAGPTDISISGQLAATGFTAISGPSGRFLQSSGASIAAGAGSVAITATQINLGDTGSITTSGAVALSQAPSSSGPTIFGNLSAFSGQSGISISSPSNLLIFYGNNRLSSQVSIQASSIELELSGVLSVPTGNTLTLSATNGVNTQSGTSISADSLVINGGTGTVLLTGAISLAGSGQALSISTSGGVTVSGAIALGGGTGYVFGATGVTLASGASLTSGALGTSCSLCGTTLSGGSGGVSIQAGATVAMGSPFLLNGASVSIGGSITTPVLQASAYSSGVVSQAASSTISIAGANPTNLSRFYAGGSQITLGGSVTTALPSVTASFGRSGTGTTIGIGSAVGDLIGAPSLNALSGFSALSFGGLSAPIANGGTVTTNAITIDGTISVANLGFNVFAQSIALTPGASLTVGSLYSAYSTTVSLAGSLTTTTGAVSISTGALDYASITSATTATLTATTSIAGGVLAAGGGASLSAPLLTGIYSASALTLTAPTTATITATVNGLTGAAAAAAVTNLSTSGTQTVNGVVLGLAASPPVVSPPAVSPPAVSPPAVSPPTVSPPVVASPPPVSPPVASPPIASPPPVSPPVAVTPPPVSPPVLVTAPPPPVLSPPPPPVVSPATVTSVIASSNGASTRTFDISASSQLGYLATLSVTYPTLGPTILGSAVFGPPLATQSEAPASGSSTASSSPATPGPGGGAPTEASTGAPVSGPAITSLAPPEPPRTLIPGILVALPPRPPAPTFPGVSGINLPALPLGNEALWFGSN